MRIQAGRAAFAGCVGIPVWNQSQSGSRGAAAVGERGGCSSGFPIRERSFGNVTRQQLSDLVEVRAVLECHAATVAAQRINEDELYALRSHVEALENGYERYVDAWRKKSDQLLENMPEPVGTRFRVSSGNSSRRRKPRGSSRSSGITTRWCECSAFGPIRRNRGNIWIARRRRTARSIAQSMRRSRHGSPEQAGEAMVAHNKRARDNLFGPFRRRGSRAHFGRRRPPRRLFARHSQTD